MQISAFCHTLTTLPQGRVPCYSLDRTLMVKAETSISNWNPPHSLIITMTELTNSNSKQVTDLQQNVLIHEKFMDVYLRQYTFRVSFFSHT